MKSKVIILVVIAILGLYVGSYVVLSSQGEYVPGAWGLGWVKWYIWAPHGFVSGPAGLRQHRLPQTAYFPLWWIDMRLIHTSDEAHDGKHPINTTLDDALQKRLNQMEQNHTSDVIVANRAAHED